jgi:AI-2 transport protein TqsA
MDENTDTAQPAMSPVLRWTFYFAAGVVILSGLKVASSIVGPLMLALVIVLGVAPFQQWLITKKRFRPALAFTVTLLLVFAFLGALFGVFWVGMSQFAAAIPDYTAQVEATREQVVTTLGSYGIEIGSIKELSTDGMMSAAGSAAGWLAGLVSSAALAITFGAFMLFDALTFPARLDGIAGENATARVFDFTGDVRRWVTITSVVNLLVAAGNTVFLLIMGIPYAPLWGVLSFMLGFIPNIGFLLSLVPPTVLALLIYGPREALMVIVFYIIINGAVQNLVTPRMMGEGLDLSVFVVIFSLVFWGFILGPIGGLMAIPLTLVLRLALESSPDTKGAAALLGAGSGKRD